MNNGNKPPHNFYYKSTTSKGGAGGMALPWLFGKNIFSAYFNV